MNHTRFADWVNVDCVTVSGFYWHEPKRTGLITVSDQTVGPCIDEIAGFKSSFIFRPTGHLPSVIGQYNPLFASWGVC